uniref:Uncharacterized protein n=1 Tax=Ananas comosus var. bracteatus TaxID=296719 RepID=A0A6V7QHF7_ANACO|nr:unnamed protein product [Ananas comosus var. bracteatus]
MLILPDLALGAGVGLYHRSFSAVDTQGSLECIYTRAGCRAWVIFNYSSVEIRLHTRLGSAHQCHSRVGLCAFALCSVLVGLALYGLISVDVAFRIRQVGQLKSVDLVGEPMSLRAVPTEDYFCSGSHAQLLSLFCRAFCSGCCFYRDRSWQGRCELEPFQTSRRARGVPATDSCSFWVFTYISCISPERVFVYPG